MRNHLLAGLCCAAALGAAATQTRAQTMNEMLVATYQTNGTIVAAREKLKETDEQLAQALAYWWRPQVTGTLEHGKQWISSSEDEAYNYVPGYVVTEDLTGTNRYDEVEITGELYVWRGGQTTAAIDYANGAIQAQEAVLAQTEQSTLSDASKAYGNIVYQLASLRLIDEHERRLQEVKAMVEDLLGRQLSTVSDLAQVELALVQLEDDRYQTDASLQTARSELAALAGIYPTEVEEWPALPQPPDDVERAIELARAGNPQILSARAEVIANEAAVREEIGGLLPTLSVVGDWTWEYDRYKYEKSYLIDDNTRSSTFSVYLELSIPFYDGGETYSEVREARRTVSQSRAKVHAADADVVNDVRQAWQNLLSAERRIDAGFRRWEAAEAALAGEERLFREGNTTIRDLISAQGDVIDAQQALQQACYDSFTATVELLVATGRFGATDLGLDVALFDPDAYLREIRDLPLGIGLD